MRLAIARYLAQRRDNALDDRKVRRAVEIIQPPHTPMRVRPQATPRRPGLCFQCQKPPRPARIVGIGPHAPRAPPHHHAVEPDVTAHLVAHDHMRQRPLIAVPAQAPIPELRLPPDRRRLQHGLGFHGPRLVHPPVIPRRRRLDLHQPHPQSRIQRQRVAIQHPRYAPLLARRKVALLRTRRRQPRQDKAPPRPDISRFLTSPGPHASQP